MTTGSKHWKEMPNEFGEKLAHEAAIARAHVWPAARLE